MLLTLLLPWVQEHFEDVQITKAAVTQTFSYMLYHLTKRLLSEHKHESSFELNWTKFTL